MGAVWRAEHLLLRSQVAIKLISPELAATGEGLSRFLREAQAAASLRSPHVVQILDYGVDEGTPYIAMELLDGESLGARLNRAGRLELAEVGRVFVQIGRAIARAHDAGIVHRDLKPDNVFIIRNDEEEVAKVLDFGIAKLSSRGVNGPATGATRTGALLGTPYYMSPEQVEGSSALDHRSDIWAIGVLAYECIVGQRPFDAETMGGLVLAICSKPLPIPSTRASVPPRFDDWFARACSRDLDTRFSSVREATRELKQLCEGVAVATFPHALNADAPAQPHADSVDDTDAPTEIYAPARHTPKSLITFTSSQPPKQTVTPRTTLLVAAAALVAVVGSVAWFRSKSELTALPAAASGPLAAPRAIPAATVPRAPAVEPAVANPNVVSLDALPTSEPADSARPNAAKAPLAPTPPARPSVAPVKVELDETPDDDGAALPENPYKGKKSTKP